MATAGGRGRGKGGELRGREGRGGRERIVRKKHVKDPPELSFLVLSASPYTAPFVQEHGVRIPHCNGLNRRVPYKRLHPRRPPMPCPAAVAELPGPPLTPSPSLPSRCDSCRGEAPGRQPAQLYILQLLHFGGAEEDCFVPLAALPLGIASPAHKPTVFCYGRQGEVRNGEGGGVGEKKGGIPKGMLLLAAALGDPRVKGKVSGSHQARTERWQRPGRARGSTAAPRANRRIAFGWCLQGSTSSWRPFTPEAMVQVQFPALCVPDPWKALPT